MQNEDQEVFSVGDRITRPTSFEPLRNGVLKLVWPSGAVATLKISPSVAAMRGVSYALQPEGVEALRTEFTFADCFGEGGEGQWSPFFLERLAKEQGQPYR